MKNTYSHLSHRQLATALAVGLAVTILAPAGVHSQPLPEFQSQFNNVVGDRVETLDIFGGDYGLSGGNYKSFRNPDGKVDVSVSKFGGYGDIGDPEPLGDTGIGFQPRLQGSMGTVESKKVFQTGELQGDVTKYDTFAIQFGGGGRFWFNDHLSLAPTIMGMYGHTENKYAAYSAFGQANYQEANQLGLINWTADTYHPARRKRPILATPGTGRSLPSPLITPISIPKASTPRPRCSRSTAIRSPGRTRSTWTFRRARCCGAARIAHGRLL